MKTMLKVVASGLALSAASIAGAAETDLRAELEALKATVQAQQTEIQQMRSASGESWLNERRAQEVKALIHEVLSDADTRASLAEGGMTAGYRDHFFLASEDGNFLLQIQGQVQFRYIYNDLDDLEGEEVEHEEGFSLPRVKLGFYGHIFDPKFTYGVRGLFTDADNQPFLGGSVNEGDMVLEEAWFAYEFADGWHLKAGQFKAPFLRDELVDSAYQQAVERSIVTDIFTTDYTQGVQVSYTTEQWRVAAMLHDGSYAANSSWDEDAVDMAVSARGEFLLAGNWAQFEDYAAFGDTMGILLGAAVTWENAAGETGATGITPVGLGGAAAGDILKWTVDGSVELPELMGLNVFGAIIGLHNDEREGQTEVDVYAAVVQAGVFVIPGKMDVFGRYEWIDTSDLEDLGLTDDDSLSIVTVGTNYYYKKHAAKVTLDLVWTMDEVPDGINSDLQGIYVTGEEDQWALRGQFQFLF